MIEKDVSQLPHTNIGSVKLAVTEVMSRLMKDDVAKACNAFTRRLQAVVDADGGAID